MTLTLQWLAGFFDGEGYVGMAGGCGASKGLYPRITITNTYLPVLKAIQAQFGGSIYICRKTDKDKGIRQCYTLSWSCKKAITLLKELVPFLTVKKSQAELLILGYTTHKRDGRSSSNTCLQQRVQLQSQLTEIKHEEFIQ